MDATGPDGGEMCRVGTAPIDYSTGSFCAAGIAFALLARHKTGRGQRLDLSLFDVGMHLMSHWITNHGLTGEDPMRMGTSNSIICPLRVFPDQDPADLHRRHQRRLLEDFLHRARQARLAGRQALRHQRRPRRQPRHPRADDRGIFPAAHLRRAFGQADPGRHGLLGRLQDERRHGEPARQGARQRAGDRLSRHRAGEVGQQSHQALRRAGRDAAQVADGGRAHGRDHARSGL